jgi:hypothetical protein
MSALFRVLPVAAGVVLLVADPAALLAQVQRAVRSSDVITRDEIERARVDDAYQAVLRLRPEFLQRSGHPRARVRSPGSEPKAGIGAVPTLMLQRSIPSGAVDQPVPARMARWVSPARALR